MKVQVEHISNIEKKVIVELPVDSVDRALDDQYKRLGRTARVKGFRPGKVPRSLIRKMFRNEAQSAASTELIQSNLLQAMEQAEVEPLNMPDIDRGELVEEEMSCAICSRSTWTSATCFRSTTRAAATRRSTT